MESAHISSSRRKEKKLVDLIYLDKYQEGIDLKPIYQSKINTWLDWMNNKLDKVAFENLGNKEQEEYFVVNHFLRHFLLSRFQWILESVSNEKLRQRYLLVLPPFTQQGTIKNFLLHFFCLKELKHGELAYCSLNNSEKEIRILWDIYKLVKTIDTVAVLKKSVAGGNPFQSQFSAEYIDKTLNTVEEMLNLLVRICVKNEHYEGIRYQFPLGVFKPETILNRKENHSYLINSVALEKFDYRNYFFHIYYKPSMKARYRGKDLSFRYNYLDFEIMRQEFLIDWLNSRLKNNSKKMSVLEQYMLGNRSFREIVKQTPEKEIQLLKKLPYEVFNDLVAHVNETVDREDRAEIDPLSQAKGEFSQQLKLFRKAKELTKKSTQAIREYVGTMKESINKTINVVIPRTQTEKEPEKQQLELESNFQLRLLKAEEINFPFFHQEDHEYPEHLGLLKSSIPAEKQEEFKNNVDSLLNSAGEERLLSRNSPMRERVLPILVKEKTKYGTSMQFLILGTSSSDNGELNTGEALAASRTIPFFVYGSKVRNFEMGETVESRTIMEKSFHVYHPASPEVVKRVLFLVDMVSKNESLFAG